MTRVKPVPLLLLPLLSCAFVAKQNLSRISHGTRAIRNAPNKPTRSSSNGRTSASFLMMAAVKKKAKKGTKKKAAVGTGGFGMSGSGDKSKKKKGSPTAAFDVSAALLRSEKMYTKLVENSAKSLQKDEDDDDCVSMDRKTSEYMIAARYKNDKGQASLSAASISDWIPVAQLCVERSTSSASSNKDDDDDHRHLQAAVSSYCREIYHAAKIGAPVFGSFPRNEIQYSAEPLDSFYKFVYEKVIEGNANGANGSENEGMSKGQAREILNLDSDGDDDLGSIKRAYRSRSFELHPDRFVGVERTDEEKDDSIDQFARVKLAYETLISGIRNSPSPSDSKPSLSWYESLGGRDRLDFKGPIDLLPIDQAQEGMEKDLSPVADGFRSAVCGLDPETIMAFVARNQDANKI